MAGKIDRRAPSARAECHSSTHAPGEGSVTTPDDHPDAGETGAGQPVDPNQGDELRLLARSEYVLAGVFQLLADTAEDPARARAYRQRATHALREAAKAEHIAAYLDLRPAPDHG